MVLAILSTLIFVPHSHQRDKWFDCCTGRARGILMDAVLIRGFVNSRRKHTLCTRRFPPPAQRWNHSRQKVVIVYLWVLSLRSLPTWYTAFEAPSRSSWLVDRPEITFVKFAAACLLVWMVSFHHNKSESRTKTPREWGERIYTGARGQPEYVLTTCVCVCWRGWGGEI